MRAPVKERCEVAVGAKLARETGWSACLDDGMYRPREQARSHRRFVVLVGLEITLIRNQSVERRHFQLFRGVLFDELFYS
jgi:hypothetical protein